MPLYSCRSHVPNEWAITKLNDELEPESTYILRTEPEGNLACECPAGVRPTCRHRQMLPHFTMANRVNTGWVLDWDNGAQWRQYVGPLGEPEPEVPGHTDLMISPEAIDTALANELARPIIPEEGYQSFASDFPAQSPRRRGF